MWDNEKRRLDAAKLFQRKRVALITEYWKKFPEIHVDPAACIHAYLPLMEASKTTEDLLSAEAHLAKSLYALLAKNFGVEFSRKPRTAEFANAFLDSGNYLAYGLAGCCLWILGIPFSYPLVHGKTRRGALVFDVADIIKDAIIMPNAFISAAAEEKESQCRRRMLSVLHDAAALRLLFEQVIAVIE
jgi:CRISPR-associated protein Cas1